MFRARHILIAFKGWWPPDRRQATLSKEEAYHRAVELRLRVLAGESFEDLARIHSDCPSRAEGGDLGVFLRGDMEDTFEEALLSVETGQLAPMVRTQHGWHVIERLAP